MVPSVRYGYNLLIITILFVCIWFVYVSIESKTFYRRMFKRFLWCTVAVYFNRMLSQAMGMGDIPVTDMLLYVERVLHFCLTVAIYALYSFFLFCLISPHRYENSRVRWLFFTPCIITGILLITSQWTHIILYVENGVCYDGTLFWLLSVVRGGYAAIATVYAVSKRHLLPRIFGQSVMLVAVFALLQAIHYVVTHDEILYYSMLIVNIVIFLLAFTMVEFYKDSITGLLNKEAFEQFATSQIGKKGNKSVYLVKLKNYEYLKDNYNNFALLGVIKQLADDILEYVKQPSVYYLGIGRYVIIINRKDKFVEEEFLSKLRERLEIPFELGDADVYMNMFVAVMNMEDGRISKENFYKYITACDEIKYRSKESIELVYSDALGMDKLQRYRNVEDAIERALAEGEFEMYYQPIYSTKDERIISAEALIRLNDRVLGYVSPEEFIPISENNGKILEISEFVLDNVFRFVSEGHIEELGLQFIEVNLSVMQCMDKNLVDRLRYYIEKYQVDPRHINLEITETAASYDEERLKKQLIEMKNLGFHFSLDDYGTGYSNLVRVLEYPVDIIKLDKSIVWSAFYEANNFIMLRNLISMFHDVQRKIVAEGIETEEQVNTLKKLECDYLQGYYYSKPVNAGAFCEYVKQYNSR